MKTLVQVGLFLALALFYVHLVFTIWYSRYEAPKFDGVLRGGVGLVVPSADSFVLVGTMEGISVKRTVQVDTSSGKRPMPYWETSSPHFVITRTIKVPWKNEPRFTLTHVKTGRSVCKANREKPLRLMAGIFGALQIPWGRIGQKTLAKHWAKMPKEIRAWRPTEL